MMESIREFDGLLDRFLGPHTLIIYGSAVTGDFRLGWSDIDFLCIADEPLSPRHMAMLPRARGFLGAMRPANPYASCLEGHFIAWESLMAGGALPGVRWGSRGGEASGNLVLDALTRRSILEAPRIRRRRDIVACIAAPTREEIVSAIADRCRDILTHGTQPSDSIRAAGWMLDTARCLYTLETGELIPKTAAGYWALGRGLCPHPDILEQVIAIREKPRAYMGQYHPADFLRELPPYVEAFGRVLEDALMQA